MFGLDLLDMVAGLPGLVMALSLHEYAHAKAADAMGDFTPRMMGRLTMNPLAHIDPIGLVMLLVAHFGWAKPVMFNPNNFRNRNRGEMIVALAGPAANLLIAFLAMTFLVVYADVMHLSLTKGLHRVLYMIIIYNINFAIFNMIPLPPLDGSKVLASFLPGELKYRFLALERYSMLIMIAFLATPVLGYILIPLEKIIIKFYVAIITLFFGGLM